MRPRTKHNLRQAAICIPIALAAGWGIAGTIIPRMMDHFWTGAMYVMITAICFDILLKRIYPKFAWTRPYEPPTFDFDDPKRINFTGMQTVSRAWRPGDPSEQLFKTVVIGFDEVVEMQRKSNTEPEDQLIPKLWPSEEELMKFCGKDEGLRAKYYKAWREANRMSWHLHHDKDWMVRHLDYAANYEEQERMRKLLLGVWEPKHQIFRYASVPYIEKLCKELVDLGYADEIVKELETQPSPISPDLLEDIFLDFIYMVRANPNEKAIFKPFPETHA